MQRSIFLSPLIGAFGLLFLVACGSPSPSLQAPGEVPAAPSLAIDASPEDDLQAILGTTVLRPGSQRIAFLLVSPKALVTVPEAKVTSFYTSDPDQQPRETKIARFSQWPYATKGSYTTELSFDRQGTWRLEIDVEGEDGMTKRSQLLVDVQDGFGLVDVNSVPPASKNKTLPGGATLAQLSSAYAPDPDLYSITIAEALSSGQPTMVVFATPAFCVSPTCGPQVETVQELKEQYKGRAHFIHVEIYDNPDEVQGDLNKARLSPIVEDWGLTSVPHWSNESWVFIMGRDGRVTARFEAYTTAQELGKALLAVLE